MHITPNHPAIRTMGRIDDDDPLRPVWIFPYTQASFRFTGTSLRVAVGVRSVDFVRSSLNLGVCLDGRRIAVPLPQGEDEQVVTIAQGLPDIQHEVTVYKRQDGNQYLTMLGFEVDDGASVLPPAHPRPTRRIEVYGDSVSCGERNEAICYAGQDDPDVELYGYSDSWMSYAALTARRLGAELHNVSQGGVSLIDGIGWFPYPLGRYGRQIGQQSMWDAIEYHPAFGVSKQWEFSRWTPHVVVVAIGQNDSNPIDFMAKDYSGNQARHWRASYGAFLDRLRGVYPHAHIVCTTTVMAHDPAWDRAIDEVVAGYGDPKVTRFLYARNGSATPGHPRLAEHEEMARELTAYLEGLGPDVWCD